MRGGNEVENVSIQGAWGTWKNARKLTFRCNGVCGSLVIIPTTIIPTTLNRSNENAIGSCY